MFLNISRAAPLHHSVPGSTAVSEGKRQIRSSAVSNGSGPATILPHFSPCDVNHYGNTNVTGV
jgi:hypothetical protein